MSNQVKTNIERGAQTLMGLERASSMMDIKKLERQEAAVIADMVSKGFKNPMEDEGHKRCLMSTDPEGRLLRRFITKLTFGGKPPVPGQVKEKQTNDDWINESLKPAILQHGIQRFGRQNLNAFFQPFAELNHPATEDINIVAHRFSPLVIKAIVFEKTYLEYI